MNIVYKNTDTIFRIGDDYMSAKIKYDKLQKKINNMENKINKSFNEINNRLSGMEKRNVMDDITRETYPGSGRPLYTYEDIGKRNNMSASKVSRIAEETGLSRRNGKVVSIG